MSEIKPRTEVWRGLAVDWTGLGVMGAPMARRLVERGHRVRPLQGPGGRGAAGVRAFHAEQPDEPEFSGAADVLALCLPTEADTAALLAARRELPPLVVDFSTMSPAAARRFEAALAERGSRYVDAPVSGSKDTARSGALTLFIGAAALTDARLTALVDALAGHALYLGATGRGAEAKLVNQVMHLANMVGLKLGRAACDAFGLDMAKLLPALSTASSSSAMLSRFGEAVAADRHAPHFRLSLACKDLRLLAEATSLEQDAAFAALRAAYGEALDRLGDVNFSAVAAPYAACDAGAGRPDLAALQMTEADHA